MGGFLDDYHILFSRGDNVIGAISYKPVSDPFFLYSENNVMFYKLFSIGAESLP